MIKKTLATAAIILSTMGAAHAETYTNASDKVKLCQTEAYSVGVLIEAKRNGVPEALMTVAAGEMKSELAQDMMARQLKNVYNGAYEGMTPTDAKKFILGECIEVQFK